MNEWNAFIDCKPKHVQKWFLWIDFVQNLVLLKCLSVRPGENKLSLFTKRNPLKNEMHTFCSRHFAKQQDISESLEVSKFQLSMNHLIKAHISVQWLKLKQTMWVNNNHLLSICFSVYVFEKRNNWKTNDTTVYGCWIASNATRSVPSIKGSTFQWFRYVIWTLNVQ